MIILILLCFLFGLSYVPIIYEAQCLKQIDNESEIVERDAFAFTNYDYYSSSELTDDLSYVNYIAWVNTADNVDLYTIGSEYTHTFVVNGDLFLVDSRNLTSTNTESQSVRLLTINTIEFHAFPRVVNDVNSYYQSFWLLFMYNNNDMYQILFNKVYNAKLGSTLTWYSMGMYRVTNGNVVDYSSYASLVVKNPRSQSLAWTRDFFNFYGSITDDSGNTLYDYDLGYNTGYNSGLNQGYSTGYNEGYTTGYNDAVVGSPEMVSIFEGVIDVGLLPVNVFLTMFNYEIFGVNVSGLVSGLLTCAIIFIILRFLFGGRNDD